MKPTSISKLLSSNDTGETGGHQAGILIPKEGEILDFFPSLDPKIKNPRVILQLHDDAGQIWNFNFIYYNGKFFGGTRNEYRLTGMTAYIRQNNLKTGDGILLSYENDNYHIKNVKQHISEENPVKLIITGSWKVIKY